MARNVGEVRHKRKRRKADPPTGEMPGDGSVVVVVSMTIATIRRAVFLPLGDAFPSALAAAPVTAAGAFA